MVVDYLYRLSEGKYKLMEQLLALTERQRETLTTVDEVSLNSLNRLIEEKQAVISKVDVLDKEFLEKFQALKAHLGVEDFSKVEGEPVPGFKALKSKVEEILEITQKIKELDDENTASAKAHMEVIKQELKTVRIGKQVSRSYGQKYNDHSQSIFIDKRR